MKAYLLDKTGKSSVLKIRELPEPSPGPGELRIKVQCIGLNFAEILSRRGQYSWAPKRPYIPGMETYGVVEAIGEGVANRQIGEKVICGWQYGSYAEKMVIPEYMAFPAIDSFSDDENAAFLVNFMTAWIGLMRLARISPGEKILINAAAGGVGTAAVQLAAAKGCKVYGTAGSEEKVKLIKSLGAELAINYREEDFETVIKEKTGSGIDAVLELVGGETYRKSISLLNPFGRLVIAGVAGLKWNKWNPVSLVKVYKDIPRVNIMKMAKASYSVSATHIGYLIKNPQVVTDNFFACRDFALQHGIKPVIGKTFSFDEIPEAHEFIESRKSHGKVVIRI